MFKLLLCCAVTLAAVNAAGEFLVLSTPPSIKFVGQEELDQSLVKDIFAVALGHTTKLRGHLWNGINVTNIFSSTKAVVAVAIEGVDSIGSPVDLYTHKYPMNVDEIEETTWQGLSGLLAERGNDKILVRMYLDDGLNALGRSSLGELKPTPIDKNKLKALNLNNETDSKFLDEIQLMHAVAKNVNSAVKPNDLPDVCWLVVSNLGPVLEQHKKNPTARAEALNLLNNAVKAVNDAFVHAYNNKVLVAAFTNNAFYVRKSRAAVLDGQIREAENQTDNNDKTVETSETKRTPNNTEINRDFNKQEDVEDQNKGNAGEEEINTSSHDIDTENVTNNPVDKGSSEKPNDTRFDTDKTKTNTQVIGQNDSDLNLAKEYDANYPIIFNIFLWFGVVFFFSLLAICIAIADMDPGRDSIIYRMTSNRMKKDN